MNIDVNRVMNLGELAKTYKWIMNIETFPISVIGPPSADELAIRCTSTDIPKREDSKTEVQIHEFTVWEYDASKTNGTINLTFVDTIDGKAIGFFRNWQNSKFDPETGIQMPKPTIVAGISLLRLNKATVPYQSYTLINAVVDDVAESPLGGEDGQKNAIVTVRIAYDTHKFKQL